MLTILMLGMAFRTAEGLSEELSFLQQCLNAHYNQKAEQKLLKKVEIVFTENGFCRYKRFYHSGKVEYYAFKLSRLKNIEYFGREEAGKLVLYTKADDVMVQTYNDKKGNIDSMASELNFPLKDIDLDALNKLYQSFERAQKNIK